MIYIKSHTFNLGGGNVVEDFYRIDMPSRDIIKAAICVGTSAVYRRAAILEAGGTPKVWGTEDVRQGLKITRAGYYVKYIPLIISIGDSPDTIQGYFRQHNRWCTGSLATVFSSYFLKAKLNFFARLSYLTNATYYIAEAGNVVFSFHLLTLLYFQNDTLVFVNSLWFIPYLIFYHIEVPFSRIHKPKFGTYLAAFSNIFAYCYTLPNIPLGRLLPWEPAGLKKKGIHHAFHNSINLGLVITSVYIVLFIFTLFRSPHILANFNAYPLLGWSLYTAFWYVVFLYFSVKYIKDIRIYEIESQEEDFKLFKKFILHFKHYALPGLSIFLITVLIATAFLQLSKAHVFTLAKKNKAEIEQVILGDQAIRAPLVSEVRAETFPDTKEKEYIYTAKRGDSAIKLSRLALKEYSKDKNLFFSKKEQSYIETILAQEHENTKIKIGTTLSFRESKISEIAGSI